ncbi:Phosphate acetyltransferase [hydrothermal vent metagenome]|uniref:Phosphate acetyltransferase n=1 Tax=hydrothermal vent metagenome TaxID=652676 RepID=A0A3B0SKQ8_9ZZZZ
MTLTPLDLLLSQAPATRPIVALSEGSDPRIIAGAQAARNAGIADVILVGDGESIRIELQNQGAQEGDGITIHDPATSPLIEGFSDAYHDLRRHKGVDANAARKAVQTPLVYAAMLVRMGHAAGTVGGAVAATPDVVRAALQVIGKAPDAAMVSSFFLMYPPENATGPARAMLYSDCGLVIDPSADDLVAIAHASAVSCRALLQKEPKIAMLSFSTKGSARHERVTKITDAAMKLQAQHPSLEVDGELQFDAAFLPSIGTSKAPGSEVAGQANVMIFPNLDAGNIAYKITQRLGGYAAIGPILQGLAKPANDLSRGCSTEDVTQMIAVTMLQASKTQISQVVGKQP